MHQWFDAQLDQKILDGLYSGEPIISKYVPTPKVSPITNSHEGTAKSADVLYQLMRASYSTRVDHVGEACDSKNIS